MKAHKLLGAVALASALPITAADVVPDVLTINDETNVYNKAVLSSVDSIIISTYPVDGIGGYITVIDKYATRNVYDPTDETMYQRSFSIVSANDDTPILKGFLSFRPVGKFPTPYFVSTGCRIEGLNNINLEWSPVEGASGYELEITNPAENTTEITTVEGTTCSMDGAYGIVYQFRVRAIHPTDPALNSDFSGRFNFTPLPKYLIATEERYEVPVVLRVTGRGEDNFTIAFDLTCGDDKYAENFDVVDGKFVADKIRISEVNKSGNVTTEIDLTDADKAAGTKTIGGLTPGANYLVSLINSSKPKYDAPYNTCKVALLSTAGEISAGELADWFEANAASQPDLTLFLAAFNHGLGDLPGECSVINLRGGKTYFLSENTQLLKGFTFRTDPADAAAGNRAVIDMARYNFNVSETLDNAPSGATLIGKIIFEDIDFVNSGALNYGDGSPTVNYFINGMSSGNVGHQYESLELRGCTFTGFIRGFVRLQGSRDIIFDHLIVDNCLFYDCGYYDLQGRGYAWFAGAGVPNQNMFKDFRFTNNTIYDSPRTSLLNDSNKHLNWDADTKWNITIENNTFVNFSTRSTSRYFFDLRYMPEGSKISFQRNLIVLATDDENRELYSAGADIRTSVTHEVKDNYSVGCRDGHLVDDGIFTSAPFSYNKNSFGAYPAANLGTPEDLVVKVGTTPLRATDLFTAPNPPAIHKAPADIKEALKYKQTPEVLNHEIYTKGIGDPRWRE